MLPQRTQDIIPQYGLSFHKPSTLWPPPPDHVTARVHKRLRERVREAVRPKDKDKDASDAAAAAGAVATTSAPSGSCAGFVHWRDDVELGGSRGIIRVKLEMAPCRLAVL